MGKKRKTRIPEGKPLPNFDGEGIWTTSDDDAVEFLAFYTRVRREQPHANFQPEFVGCIEWLFAYRHKLEAFGIDPEEVAGALDAEDGAVSSLCLRLMDLIVEREDRSREGESHLASRGEAISDSMVNHLIVVMIDAYRRAETTCLPLDLLVLVRHQFGAGASSEKAHAAKKMNRSLALQLATGLLRDGEVPTVRRVASIMGINQSTVSRWFPNGDLQVQAQKLVAVLGDFTLPRGS